MSKSSHIRYGSKVPQSYGELFDVCANRSRGNPESAGAFDAVRDRLAQAQERVFQCVKDAGERGRTTDEIALVLGLTPNEVSPRISELHFKLHKIEKIGTRPTRRNHPAAVWKAI